MLTEQDAREVEDHAGEGGKGGDTRFISVCARPAAPLYKGRGDPAR